MKIHEYQGKKIFSDYGMPVQDGYIFEKIEDAEKTIKRVQKDFNTRGVVVKAQIHAGGRGKGGGVKYSPNFENALENARNILGMNLVTHQTGTQGQIVKKVYVTEAYDIAKEFYAAITLDRSKCMDVFMVSSEGGMEIEKVAEEFPDKISKVLIDPLLGMHSFQAKKLAYALELSGEVFKSAVKIFLKMYKCYQGTDATIVEVNPLILTKEQKLIVLDSKMNFDSNALFRQKDIADMRDLEEEDPMEIEAGKFKLNYIKLDGNVGCMVNGAGLAMATMDIIKLSGGEPANFLDVGGTASSETVKNGFRIILSDKNVKAVLINIFGGIVRCDRVANGVVEAVKELGLDVPVVVRLEGTNADIARKILSESKVSIIAAVGMKDAAEKVVTAALGK
ncbi:MAG: ADP-forming succinate--CoA ligase subunit beta [Candidatus Marinimicrobia bacterium]|nr:ADP-forming succinate--CoA ligase subunit beta [Candidatus Neomarinimicrobiota bacterium]